MDAAWEEQIRQRAYQIWVDLGRSDGQAHDHWLAAERDVVARSDAAPLSTTRKGAKAAKPASLKAVSAKIVSAKGVSAKTATAKAKTAKRAARPDVTGASA